MSPSSPFNEAYNIYHYHKPALHLRSTISAVLFLVDGCILLFSIDNACDAHLRAFIGVTCMLSFFWFGYVMSLELERGWSRCRSLEFIAWLLTLVFLCLGQLWVVQTNVDRCQKALYVWSIIRIIFIYLSIISPLFYWWCLPYVHLFAILMGNLSTSLPPTKERVARLPTSTFTTDNSSNNTSSSTCFICCEKFKLGDEINTLPCSHKFHKICTEVWFRAQAECCKCEAVLSNDAAENNV